MSAADNNSTRKLAIEKVPKGDGSNWIEVLLKKYGPPHPRLRPSFLDLHRIIQGIAECEDEKYPAPMFAGRGRLASFLRDAVYEKDFTKLAIKYKIPERDGDAVINTNGANLAREKPALTDDARLDLEIIAQDRRRARR